MLALEKHRKNFSEVRTMNNRFFRTIGFIIALLIMGMVISITNGLMILGIICVPLLLIFGMIAVGSKGLDVYEKTYKECIKMVESGAMSIIELEEKMRETAASLMIKNKI